MGEQLFACENCGAWWGRDGIADVWLERGSDEVTALCFPCIGHAIRCDHAQHNPKRCAYCWKTWAKIEGQHG